MVHLRSSRHRVFICHGGGYSVNGDCKVETWQSVKQKIVESLGNKDHIEEEIILNAKLQLVQTLRVSSPIKCMSMMPVTNGSIFIAHHTVGVDCQFSSFFSMRNNNSYTAYIARCKIPYEVTNIMFIPKYKKVIGFCTDNTLRVFDDCKYNCRELATTSCQHSVLSLIYNTDTDEIVAGFRGGIMRWKIGGMKKLLKPLQPGEPFETNIPEMEWVKSVQIDRFGKYILATSENGIFIINYISSKQVAFIPNRHQASLTCFAFYNPLQYFVTSAGDGSILVWNSILFNLVSELKGHIKSVTSLCVHSIQPLLFSASKDGTVRVWRLDTMELFQRLDVASEVIWMTLRDAGELCFATVSRIRTCKLNLFYQLFTPMNTPVLSLCAVRAAGYHSKILAVGEDCSVRLISPCTGKTITLVYPLAMLQPPKDLVYSSHDALLYFLIHTGEVVVFDCTLNPCLPIETLTPASPDESITALALLKLDCALGQKETLNCPHLIFAGLKNGQISLLAASCGYHMVHPVQAHYGKITGLRVSFSSHTEGSRTLDKLVSCGTDQQIKIWELEVKGRQLVSLFPLNELHFDCKPTNVTLSGDTVCFTATHSSVLRMYCQTYVCDLATRNCSGLIAQIPDHEEEHVLEITSVDCCPWLELFVTVAKDHHLKLWDYHNKLVREIVFDASLRSACFANERGDLLVGYQNHISYIPADKYLPVQYLEKLVELELQDDVIEEPIAFDARVQLNFDLEKLPSGLTHFTRDISYSPGRQVDVEWDSSVLWEATQLALPEELGVGGSTPFKLSSAHVHVPRVLPRQLYGYDTVIDHSVPPPSTEWGEEAADDTDKEMVKESKDGKEKGMEDEKKVQKRKYPIAPDGYIPNSVVRRLIPGFRTQPDFLQLQQASKEKWTLDKLPVFQQKRFRRLWGTRKDSEDFLSREEEEDSSSDKPFFWDEESDEEVSTVDEEVSAPDSAASQDQETKTEPRKFLDIKLGKFEVNKVDWNSFRGKKGVFAAKEKFKSLPKPSDITEAKEEAIETKPSIPDQTAPQATKATKKEVPELLVKISREPWFPTGYSLTVVEVIRAFNTITDNLSDTHQRELSQYIVEIFKTLGIPYVSLVDTVDKCLEQLEGSSRTAVKRNAAWVLGELGVDQQKVITGLVKKLLDRDAGVVDECLTALKKIKGVENKADLLSLINNIETLKKLDTRQLEELYKVVKRLYKNEALYELANRLQVGGSELEQEEVMKRIQSWIHNAQTDLTTDVTTDQDKTDGAEYDKKTTEQERKRKQAVASIPKAEASKVTSKSVLRLPGVRNKAAESLTKIAGPGEVAPVRIKTKQLPAIRLGTKPESPDSRPVSQASSGSTSSGRSKKPSTPKFLPNRPEMYRYYGRQSSVGSNRSTPTEKVSAAQGPSDQAGSEEGETRKGVTTPKTLVTQEEKDIPAPLVTQPDDTSGVSLVTPGEDTVHAPSVVLPPVVQKSDNVDSTVSAAADDRYKETVSTLPTLPPISDNKLLHQHLHDKFSDYDSDIHSASVGPGSQFWEDGSLQNLKARDYTSADDSGFSCISDQSTLETSKQDLSLVSRGEPQLSPVKSITLLTKEGSKHDNWRQFFERTSALDRKRIAEVKEDIAHGKHKPLPQTEVSYIKHKRVQFVPGDAGVRLLHTITISGDKLQEAEDSRHFISAMPGRLGMHTTSETFGHSKYGILNMNWTTNVPVPLSNFRYQQWRKRQQPKKHLEAVIRAPPTSSSSVTRFPQLVKLHELKLIESAKSAAEQEIPKVTYRWESPLPPPPGRRSRLGDADTAKQHNHYCEYYNLAKKKMHHFTSTSDVTTLPKLVQKVPSVHSYLPPHPSPDHNRTAVDSLPPVNLKAMTARS